MAAKKKTRIQASDVEVGKRTLEAVLIDLAEQVKASADRAARIDDRSARAEERSARAEERSARAEEGTLIALQTIAAVSRDLQAITLELRTANARTQGRLDALEQLARTGRALLHLTHPPPGVASIRRESAGARHRAQDARPIRAWRLRAVR